MLDALDPGSPAQLVADVRAAGAAGCGGYVWRPGGVGQWDQSHFDALAGAGLLSYPLVVPAGDGSTSPDALIHAAQSFGFAPGGVPLVVDMEGPYNLPPASWWQAMIAAGRAAGYRVMKYGNGGDVGAYALGDGWLEAYYVQHSVEPFPSGLPAGTIGWQYANVVGINGITYDVNAIEEAFFMVRLDPNDPQVEYIKGRLDGIINQLIFGNDVQEPGGTVHTRIGLIADVFNLLTEVQTEISQAPPGAGLTAAQAQQLADLAAGLPALQATLTRIETALKGA